MTYWHRNNKQFGIDNKQFGIENKQLGIDNGEGAFKLSTNKIFRSERNPFSKHVKPSTVPTPTAILSI